MSGGGGGGRLALRTTGSFDCVLGFQHLTSSQVIFWSDADVHVTHECFVLCSLTCLLFSSQAVDHCKRHVWN